MAIDPAELEGLDEEGVRALYEERLAQQQSTASREVTPAALPCPARAPFHALCTRLQGAPRAAALPHILQGHPFLLLCPLVCLSLRSLLD